ncbi:MAG: LysR family transcriptional regulator [Thermaerobacter sp.]|nr:LysR family transcriptional regulator [Thermaerobacter sp.]
MGIRLLRYVVAIHREKSVAEAAHRLGNSQPSLSQQVAKWERERGVRRFHRESAG